MTGLAANVASLATSLGAVASNVTRLVAVIAALHGKATGIVATLRAAARHVTSLVAIVTTQLWPLLQRETHLLQNYFFFVSEPENHRWCTISQS